MDKRKKRITNHKVKRLLCGILIMCQIFSMTAYAIPDWPNDTGIQAEAGALMDVDSGTLIFGQNSRVAYPPASITKILTALIVLEHTDDLSETVTFSESAMMSVEADSGNKLSLVIGDTMTVEDALYALLLVSVNQAANALAEHVAGSISGFVDMMNAKLEELGCTDSHFDNPSGLNGDTQNVSAYDMAKIACAAYQNEKLLEISSSASHKIGALENHPDGITVNQEHRLVVTEDTESPYYCPEVVAGKTGYLLKAGNTLVTYAEKDGRRLVSVILKGTPGQYFVDGKELLRFGFDSFYNLNIAENETRYVTGEDPVEIGGQTYAPADLIIETGTQITLPETAAFSDAELTLAELPENHPEHAVGLLQYTYNDRKIGQAYLLLKSGETAGADAEQMSEMKDSADAEDGQGEVSRPAAADADGKNINRTSGGFPVIPVILVILVLLVAALCVVLVRRVQENRRREEEAAARRERRRQRLMEEGADVEAEFNRLLEERKRKGGL